MLTLQRVSLSNIDKVGLRLAARHFDAFESILINQTIIDS